MIGSIFDLLDFVAPLLLEGKGILQDYVAVELTGMMRFLMLSRQGGEGGDRNCMSFRAFQCLAVHVPKT